MNINPGFKRAFQEELERAELVALLLRESSANVRPSAVTAQPRTGVLPLSYAQERLWLLEQLGLVGSAYNLPAAVRIRGALAVGGLAGSFVSIVDRHEGLRTRFAVSDGSPIQVIDAAGQLVLQVEDLGGLPEGEREAQASWLRRRVRWIGTGCSGRICCGCLRTSTLRWW